MTETTGESETPVTPPSYFIDEGIPGVGERPSWLNEKFKSVADLAKSYHELEKKMAVVPDEYDLSNSKYLDKESDQIKDFLDFARSKRVPKDVMDKMVESMNTYWDKYAIDYDAEAKKLGENAKERLTTLDNWAKANLSEPSYEALTRNLNDADAVKALEELRGKMMSSSTMVPNGNDGASSNTATLEDLKTELSNNLEKYKKDPEYRKQLQARLEVASKNSGYIDKMGS
jgi:hypothetical protein